MEQGGIVTRSSNGSHKHLPRFRMQWRMLAERCEWMLRSRKHHSLARLDQRTVGGHDIGGRGDRGYCAHTDRLGTDR